MSDKEILAQYIPEAAIDKVLSRIIEKRVHLKITRGRRTKLGDYRPPVRHPNHRITINHDLNPYAFLITFIHEFAHLLVFEQYKNKVPPHGKEWKTEYRKLMTEFFGLNVFPPELQKVLEGSIRNAKASTFSELELSRLLNKYDKPDVNGHIHLEALPSETVFITRNGRKFVKGEKLRKRFKCRNLQNNRIYLFHPLTPVRVEGKS
ncbi:MAG: SprT family zinc-dependent metalloprotease [Chlorobi bacterium]|nr:SprT family zinc-dependent metalloprotease [Chlorobiota bacterium]